MDEEVGESRVAKDSDELFRMMEEDELEDQAATQTHMAVSEYARLRHITPQNVHYYIRNKRLKKYRCVCGKPVINIEEADIALRFKEPPGKESGNGQNADASREEQEGKGTA